MKLLLYCTKSKPCLMVKNNKTYFLENKEDAFNYIARLNGYIVAECDYEIEEIEPYQYQVNSYEGQIGYKTKTLTFEELLKKSCLTFEKLDRYLYVDIGYAIYIKNLHIFDEPRELSQYHIPYGCINISCERKTKQKYLGCSLVRHCKITQIKKAPQNMMKVESKICDEKDYILISIRPEWLCKILNGEKTIEVRKKVLKVMLENDND